MWLGKLALQNGQCPKHQSVKTKKAPNLILGALLTQRHHVRWLSTANVVKIIVRHATHPTLIPVSGIQF